MAPSYEPPEGFIRSGDGEKNFDLAAGLAASGFSTSTLVCESMAKIVYNECLDERAIRTTWQVGDRIANGLRAELADRALPEEGVPVWHTISFMVPQDMPLDHESAVTILQFHTPDYGHKPQIALRYGGHGHLDVTFNHELPDRPGDAAALQALQKKPLRIEHLRRGLWHCLDVLVTWSPDPDGRIDILFNRQHVLHYAGVTTFPDQNGLGPYFKFGVYPSDGNSSALTMYHARYDRIERPHTRFLAERGFLTAPEALAEAVYIDGDPRIVVTDG